MTTDSRLLQHLKDFSDPDPASDAPVSAGFVPLLPPRGGEMPPEPDVMSSIEQSPADFDLPPIDSDIAATDGLAELAPAPDETELPDFPQLETEPGLLPDLADTAPSLDSLAGGSDLGEPAEMQLEELAPAEMKLEELASADGFPGELSAELPDIGEALPVENGLEPIADSDGLLDNPLAEGQNLQEPALDGAGPDMLAADSGSAEQAGAFPNEVSETEIIANDGPDATLDAAEPDPAAMLGDLDGLPELNEVAEAATEAHPAGLDDEGGIAPQLAASLADIEQKLTGFVTNSVAGVLAHVLGEELVRKSVEALAARLVDALRTDGAVCIDVRGPRSLFDKLSEAVGDNAPKLRHTEDDGPDLLLEIDSQIFCSRLGEWQQNVEECLA